MASGLVEDVPGVFYEIVVLEIHKENNMHEVFMVREKAMLSIPRMR